MDHALGSIPRDVKTNFSQRKMSLGTPMRRRVRDSYAVEDSYDIDHKRWAPDGAKREAPDAYASLISLPSEGLVLWVRGGFWVLVRYGSYWFGIDSM